VLPSAVDSHDVKTLAKAMEETMGTWQTTVFKPVAAK
jgi:hypothetical protein